jgi:hypothetical protein
MAIGYDLARPEAKDYNLVMRKLSNGRSNLGNNEVGLLVFGSYMRGTYTPGRSDIDAVIFLPGGVVIPKGLMHSIACEIDNALGETNVPLKPSPLDVVSMEDGRFNSFTSEFVGHLTDEGSIVFGPDYRSKMAFLGLKRGEESSLSHNLRKARTGRLLAEYHNRVDYDKLIENFKGTLDAVITAPRQLLSLMGSASEGDKGSQIEKLNGYLPSIKIEPLMYIRHIQKHPEKLDRLYQDYSYMMDVWDNSLTCLEEMISAFIKKVPRS